MMAPPIPAEQGEPSSGANPWLRVGAGLLGAALIPAILIGMLITLVAAGSSAQEPNPFIADGFMCCSHPDTWNEVIGGTLLTGAFAAATVLLVMLMIWLLGHAALDRRVSRRALFRIPAVAGGVTLAGMAALVAPQVGDARVAPDCDGFVVNRGALHDRRGGPASGDQIMGIAACDAVDGKTVAEVKALLGPPDFEDLEASGPGDGPLEVAVYGILTLRFEHGRVSGSRLESPGSGYD